MASEHFMMPTHHYFSFLLHELAQSPSNHTKS
uniref:Uncharacterized protein n=1 Tax=Rhizophora mucronata TaxID=61149 RepID=A0A2P2QZV2_RHIMU